MKKIIVSQNERARISVTVYSKSDYVFYIECERYEYLPSDENPLRIAFYSDNARFTENLIAVFEAANVIGFTVKLNE